MRALMNLKPLRDPAEVKLPILAEHPKFKAVAAEYSAIEARLTEAERRQRIAQARRAGQQSTTSYLDRAKALVSGGQVMPPRRPRNSRRPAKRSAFSGAHSAPSARNWTRSPANFPSKPVHVSRP